MMQIWIVWKEGQVASFSSEARARRFIAMQARPQDWRCSATELNPEPRDYTIGQPNHPAPIARHAARMAH